MGPDRPLPHPLAPEAKPYWEGMKQSKLMLPECHDCRKTHFYPRIFCPHCHSRNLAWIEASGRGKLYAFEILYRSFNPAVKTPLPYVLAMIELEEGPRMLSNLINVKPDPNVIRCDMPVEVVFTKLNDDFTIAFFQPAGKA
jgi:uncharacterized OB-fold protein